MPKRTDEARPPLKFLWLKAGRYDAGQDLEVGRDLEEVIVDSDDPDYDYWKRVSDQMASKETIH